MDDLLLSSYDYEIDKSLIAQNPCDLRDNSRLFIIDRKSETFEHKNFYDLPDYFQDGDCLVINDTKVIPSRVHGRKISGGKVELLFLEPYLQTLEYKVLMKPFVDIGKKILFEDNYECIIKSKNEKGEIFIIFNKPIIPLLESKGLMPLPSYINRKNDLAMKFADLDRQRYQTIYANSLGAIAAPTAGLHFTNDVLDKLKKKGVQIARITLHVGWGTFKPIISPQINHHQMLAEKFSIDKTNASIINCALKNNKTICSVGTTTARTLETLAEIFDIQKNGNNKISSYTGETDIFIYPTRKFRIINRLITNLHLPKSTPLMMASAFAGRQLILKAYKKAVQEKYRFFSYGDSMMIL